MIQKSEFYLVYFTSILFCEVQTKLCSIWQFCVTMLLDIEAIFPGLKTLLFENGISVQGQYCYPLRTSVGLLGEQPISKDPKTAGLFISCHQ